MFAATSKGTLAFEEDEEALGLAGGSTATPSKTGSSKLPEAFKEDVTGNDTFRSKASQGTLPGAAKQSGEASDTLAGKAGANSSAVKASMDKLADEAETGFEDFASGLGSSSSSSKSSKGLTGSPGSKATSSLSNADTMDEYDEESGFSGGGSKVNLFMPLLAHSLSKLGQAWQVCSSICPSLGSAAAGYRTTTFKLDCLAHVRALILQDLKLVQAHGFFTNSKCDATCSCSALKQCDDCSGYSQFMICRASLMLLCWCLHLVTQVISKCCAPLQCILDA